ncbi:potassium channel subfamily K member 1-like, partial [Ctenocephalides felis]|uniref:potassium channel subfamily K member 1-like n=1 Tax=Ctenocephalides felis TaxID=7515 RepID=UPI000E6E520C
MDTRNYGSTQSHQTDVVPTLPETVRLLPDVVAANLSRYSRRPRNSLLFLFVMFYVLYLVTGGLIFSALETPLESQLQQEILQTRQKFLNDYPCVDEAALETLIRKVLAASDNGVSAVKNATGDSNWTFAKSLFFSSTIITTIGYGQVSPVSQSGKIFCMLYGCAGIPLTLVLFSALVERMLTPARGFLRLLMTRLAGRCRPFGVRLLHLMLYVSFVLVFFFFIPATIFNYLEPEWDYLDSIYYCFISLTTIGLGDYVPGDATVSPYRAFYKIATTCYLLVGLAFMMLFLTIFADIPQLNLGLLFSNFDSDKFSKLTLTVDDIQSQRGTNEHNSPHNNSQIN